MRDFLDPDVRAYLAVLAGPPDSFLDTVYRRSKADGVPAIDPEAARLLRLLARMVAARRVLEIGTGYGYSALNLASGMDDGGLIFTIEFRQARADIAREHFAQAGLADRVTVMIGDARRLVHKVAGPFDLILVDAGKQLLEPLHDRTVALLRPGGVLVTDNILWDGDVIPGFNPEPHHDRESTEAVVAHGRRLAADARLDTVCLPVGDGLALSIRRGE
ncbi:MAG: O-methyltransferase [Acidobacteriota bacterium]